MTVDVTLSLAVERVDVPELNPSPVDEAPLIAFRDAFKRMHSADNLADIELVAAICDNAVAVSARAWRERGAVLPKLVSVLPALVQAYAHIRGEARSYSPAQVTLAPLAAAIVAAASYAANVARRREFEASRTQKGTA